MKAFDWLKPKAPELKDANAEIRVIGDRSAGKTAYMASLAYWPNAKADSPVQSVTPVGNQEASAQLMNMAQNILEQGLELEPTPLEATVDEVKDYGLSIVLKEQFSLKNLQRGLSSSAIRLNVNCKDYSGEFLRDLINKTGDPRLVDYLEDCVVATGLLLLVDGTSHRKDKDYAIGLEKFLAALDRVDINPKQRRVAFAVSKCELSQLWVSRHEPRKLTQRRFPLMQNKLENWVDRGGGEVDYFATSAFGTLGTNYPEPNSIEKQRNRQGTTSIIRDPKRWRPFGLVSPIYWLCTGQRHKELDKD
jgi:hypothetical protein